MIDDFMHRCLQDNLKTAFELERIEPMTTVNEIEDEAPKLKVEIFSSRHWLSGRKQWHWRAVRRNGRKVAGSLEGYNNFADMRTALYDLRRDFGSAHIFTKEIIPIGAVEGISEWK